MVIYKFTHIATGRVYIGQTIQDANRRRLEHLSASREEGSTTRFHNALRKYGENAFTFEVVTEASSINELNRLEVKYITEYNSISNGFNLREGGDNKQHSQESIEKMRASQKAAHARRREAGTDTWTRKDGGAMCGKNHSKETKAKMSSAQKGKKKWSDEDKAKMSATRKGRPISDTHRANLCGRTAWNKGKTGGTQTEEHKEKVRQAMILSWKKRKLAKEENN
jgi:group I intron endonuclease